MIRIVRPASAPQILLNRGQKERNAHCTAFDAAPDDYRTGVKTFGFVRDVYGAKSVKNKLIKAQLGKCVFCESKVAHIAYGDVEHFRPKAAYTQTPEQNLQRPGYYWLAYEWSNLFFSCQLCNQRHKKNYFPIENEANRARSHHDPIEDESPLFIDPAQEDPADHIGFRQEIAYGKTPRGEVAIGALALNREELVERRRDHLQLLVHAAETMALLRRHLEAVPVDDEATRTATQIHITKVRMVITRFQMDKAEYVAMARTFFASR